MSRFFFFTVLCCVIMLSGCSGGKRASADGAPDGGDTITHHSELLTLVDYGSWTLAEISIPWDSVNPPARLALVNRNTQLPQLPEGVTVVRIPVQRGILTSTVHLAALKRLDALDAVAGLTDAQYAADPAVIKAVAEGKIADCGTSTAPVIEQIVNADPDAFLATPYADSDHSAIARMKIPVVEMADYLETSPQGRAEWLRLIGRLVGRGAKADSLFNASTKRYEELKSLAADKSGRPKVLTEMLTSGVWYVPGGRSYMARILMDAGGEFPFADTNATGSVPLDFAAVLDRAGDADVWIVKTYGTDATLSSLAADNPLYRRLSAWQKGEVYGADTSRVPLYEEFPFAPELLLSDYIRIFHPELADSLPPARYFHKIASK